MATQPFFVCLPSALLKRTDLSSTAKLLLALLDDHRNKETGQCNPSRALLAQEMGMAEAAIKRGLCELRSAGLIEGARGRPAAMRKLAPRPQWGAKKNGSSTGHSPAKNGSSTGHSNGSSTGHSPSASLYEPKQVEPTSNSGTSSEAKTTTVVATSAPVSLVASPRQELATQLGLLLRFFADFGRGCTEADRQRCERAWRKLSPEQRLAAGEHLRENVAEWRGRPTEKIPQPWNYLEGTYWERTVRRIQPQRETGDMRERLLTHLRRKYGAGGTA